MGDVIDAVVTILVFIGSIVADMFDWVVAKTTLRTEVDAVLSVFPPVDPNMSLLVIGVVVLIMLWGRG